MTIERYIRLMAGFFIMLSLGLNLFQSGITNFCPPSFLLKKLGVPEGGASCAR